MEAWERGYTEEESRIRRLRSPGPAPDYLPETVEALVEEAKFHAAFEESRLNSARQRASWLLAFDGVLIGLAASQSHALLTEARRLGTVGRPMASISLGVAMVLVLASAMLALMVIFRAKSWIWSPEEIERMPCRESVTQERGAAQGSFLRGLTLRIVAEAKTYQALSRRLNAAFATLAAGLVAVVISIGVYAVRTVQNPCPRTQEQVSAANGPEARAWRIAPVVLRTEGRFDDTSGSDSPSGESPFRCPKGDIGTRSPS